MAKIPVHGAGYASCPYQYHDIQYINLQKHYYNIQIKKLKVSS
jgi:hypothetical protein